MKLALPKVHRVYFYSLLVIVPLMLFAYSKSLSEGKSYRYIDDYGEQANMDRCPGSKSNYEETVFKLKVLNSWYQQYRIDKSDKDFETYARSHAPSILEATFYDKNSPTYVFHSNYLNSRIIRTDLRKKTKDGAIVSFYVKNGNRLLIITHKAHEVSEIPESDLVPAP